MGDEVPGGTSFGCEATAVWDYSAGFTGTLAGLEVASRFVSGLS